MTMPGPYASALRLCRGALAIAALIATMALLPQIAWAQVVVLVNGAPITELDISQRTKLIQLSQHKSLSRKQVIEELIDDQLKIFVPKRYGMELTTSDVDTAFNAMAQRMHISPQQLEQTLNSRGIAPTTLRFKIRADLGWTQLVRGRYQSSLEISDADIRNAMQSRTDSKADSKEETVGYIYTMYPIMFIAPRGSEAVAGRQREAENLRGRFQSCNEGLKLARLLRDVIVREPVTRNSADLAVPLREMLNKMEIGTLTPPEATEQGIQMFALCDRKETKSDTPAKRAIREELFTKRYEAESKKFLAEVRRQAMIEYR